MAEEFGDFSHHRPVLLDNHSRRAFTAPDPAPPAELIARATATAERYFDAGYPGIAWKVSEGLGYEDPTWRGAYATAVRRGKWFLGYHFDRAEFDGAAQFDWFYGRMLAAAGGRLRGGGLDRLCLDSEDTRTPAGARASAVAFTSRAVTRGQPVGCVYSALFYDSWTRPNTIRLDLLPAGWRNGWLADYTAGEADAAIGLPDGWTRGQVWARQYTSTRPGLPGLPDGCDFNRTLRPWPTGTPQPAPAEPAREDPDMFTVRRPDGAAYLITPNRLRGISADQLAALTAAGVPSNDLTQAQISAIDAALGSDAAVVAGQALTAAQAAQTAVAQLGAGQVAIRAAVGALADDEAHVVAAVRESQTGLSAAVAEVLRELAAGGGGSPGPSDPGFPDAVADRVLAKLRAVFNTPGPAT